MQVRRWSLAGSWAPCRLSPCMCSRMPALRSPRTATMLALVRGSQLCAWTRRAFPRARHGRRLKAELLRQLPCSAASSSSAPRVSIPAGPLQRTGLTWLRSRACDVRALDAPLAQQMRWLARDLHSRYCSSPKGASSSLMNMAFHVASFSHVAALKDSSFAESPHFRTALIATTVALCIRLPFLTPSAQSIRHAVLHDGLQCSRVVPALREILAS